MAFILPFLVIVIFIKTSQGIEDQKKKDIKNLDIDPKMIPQNTFDLQKIWPVFYTLTIVLSYMSFRWPGMSIRLLEHDSKIRYFLRTAKGSRAAYLLSIIATDILLIAFVLFAVMILAKYLCKAGDSLILLSATEIKLGGSLLLYQTNMLLLHGYIVSFLFASYRSYLSYYALASMACFAAQGGLVYLSLDYTARIAQTGFQRVLNYALFAKLNLNAMITFVDIPAELHGYLKETNRKRHGGYEFNTWLALAHSFVYFLVIYYLDSRKYASYRRKEGKRVDLGQVTLEEGQELNQAINQRVRNQDEVDREHREVEMALGSPGTMPIKVVDVYKAYKSKKQPAVDNVSFGLQKSSIFCLLGPNGAGKSTLLDIICGIKSRTDGEIELVDRNFDRQKFEDVSFCLQQNFLWDHLTFREHVEIVGRWRGLRGNLVERLLEDLSLALDIGKDIETKAMNLSGGNKRKLNTFLALLSCPRVFVLDEPTAGMDPTSRRFFWNVLNTWKRNSDSAIVLTTHTANEAEVRENSKIS